MGNPNGVEKAPVTKRQIVGVLLFWAAVLLLVVYFAVRSPKATTATVPALNQKALQFVDYLVIDDIKTGMSGGNAVAWGADAYPGLPQVVIHTTAKDYEVAYDANEIAADNRFKEKKVLLSGEVVSIDKDFTDAGIVTLRGSGLIGIHAELSANGMAGAASFVKGQHVQLMCTGTGRVMTIATLNDCMPFQDYLSGLSPSIESTLSNFLRGQTPLPKSAATVVIGMYVVGMSLPVESPCLNGVKSKCRDEMTTLLNDPSKSTAMRNQVTQMMKVVKVN